MTVRVTLNMATSLKNGHISVVETEPFCLNSAPYSLHAYLKMYFAYISFTQWPWLKWGLLRSRRCPSSTRVEFIRTFHSKFDRKFDWISTIICACAQVRNNLVPPNEAGEQDFKKATKSIKVCALLCRLSDYYLKLKTIYLVFLFHELETFV